MAAGAAAAAERARVGDTLDRYLKAEPVARARRRHQLARALLPRPQVQAAPAPFARDIRVGRQPQLRLVPADEPSLDRVLVDFEAERPGLAVGQPVERDPVRIGTAGTQPHARRVAWPREER
jgi:hypothetical protein